MVKKSLIVLFCLALPLAMIAQERTGNITGTVVDSEGNALPGITITLSGSFIMPIPTVSSADGKFRFLSLSPAKDYQLKLELQGFKTRIETGIVVNINKTADLRLTMEMGKIEEQVTVVATTPVVQAKKTQITHTVSYEQLQNLPSARDPWVVLQLTPSVMIDRENIGGVDSGQQSAYVAKGSTSQEWTLDGMQITDRSSISSPSYWDFDMFEEMQISTGQLDVEHRDNAVVMNLVTRRGGNKPSLGGRYFFTSGHFQGAVSPERLAEFGLNYYNRAVDIKDFGFNAGGAIFKDKLWWWGAYGIQQINVLNLLNINDKTFLNNYSAKINFQLIPENRAEITYILADKTKDGRDSNESFPPGYRQSSQFNFGNPTYKFQDEHMFGDSLFLSIRVGKSNPGFGMWPQNDQAITKYGWYDVEGDLWNTNSWFYSDRPHPYGVFQVQYFNDNLFGTGTSHELKLGFEYNNNRAVSTSGWAGNFYVQSNYQWETVDWDRDGNIDVVRDLGVDLRDIEIWNAAQVEEYQNDRIAAYLSDQVSIGRFSLNLGLRFDRAKDRNLPIITKSLWTDTKGLASVYQENYPKVVKQLFPQETIDKINALLPTKTVPQVDAQKIYNFFSPRVGLTWDIFGDGKTVVKGAYSLYPGGIPGLEYVTPYGAYPWTSWWWVDGNGNNMADSRELYWADTSQSNNPVYRVFDDAGNFQGNLSREYGTFWGGWDPANPQGLSKSTSYIDSANWETDKSNEIFLAVEHELMADFGVSLSYTWKRIGSFSRTVSYYPKEFYPTFNNHARSKDDYEVAGTIPNQLVDPATGKTYSPGAAAGKPWYVLKNNDMTLPTPYTLTEMMDPDRHNIYWGFDLVFNKRLSNKWMMNGSVSYQMQKQFFGSYGYTDPTNIWAYEGSIYGISMGGGSGKVARPMFSKWMVKLTGMYQLPWDVNLSGTLSGHQGAFYSETFGINDRTLPNSRSNSNTMPTSTYNDWARVPDVWVVNLKVEKMLKLGDTSRMYFGIDLFNVTNSSTLLRKLDVSLGTFRVAGTTPVSRTAPGANSGKANELMNPFIFRLGMRFQI